MKLLTYILSFSFFIFTAACSAKGENQARHTRYPVRWYSGYTLQQYLVRPVHITKKSELLGLLNKKWDHTVPVRPSGKKTIFKLRTCQAYFNTKQQALQPVNDIDFSPFVELALMCQATRAIAQAIPARISTFSELKFDRKLPTLLPAKMAMITSTMESQRILANKTIKHMSQVNKMLKVERHSRYDTTYVEDTQDEELQLVARGDFNHDGIEDYLISSLGGVHGGSYAAFRLFLITHRPGQADYTLIKEYQY